jgi:hypothetical protein
MWLTPCRRSPPPWSVEEQHACFVVRRMRSGLAQCEFWKMSKTMMIAPRTIIQLEI